MLRRSLWFWAAIVLGVGALDVAILAATGNGNSGEHDGAGQVFGFLVFVSCVVLLVGLATTAVVITIVRHWRNRPAI